MAGLYIHIPFCKHRCIYCGFYSTTSLEWRSRYVNAICREMQLRTTALGGSAPTALGDSVAESIATIYLGGGTPSQLTIPHLEQLFLYINKVYRLTEPCEMTIEVNPDDVTADYAAALQHLGINRVSMGAQTFDDQRLRFLHRRHTAAQVSQAVRLLREAGIQNISVDLMYGFPGETLADWHHDIDAVLALDVEHISAYCLTIEEGTPLHRMLNGDCPSCEERSGLQGDCPLSEETERQMYEMLIDQLTAAGYEHYEISNFARSGYRSRHNSSYWNDVPYIGLGADAHSYMSAPTVLGGSAAETRAVRSWNVSDLRQYIDAIERGELPSEHEVLDPDTHYNDRIATALRTSDGLDLMTLDEKHRRYCLKEAEPFINDGLLQLHNGVRLILTRKGLFISDMVMSSLMLV